MAGQAVEANRFAKYRQVMETEEYYRDLAAGDDAQKRESLGSVHEQFRKTLLSDKVLLASGWKQSELESVRDELSKYADTDSIMDRIVTKGGDVGIDTAYEMLWDDTSKKLESTNKSVAESYRREIRENVGFDRVTPKDLEQARKDVALARERDDIAGEHAAALRGDGAAMTRIIKRGGEKLSDALLERMNESIAGRLSTPGGDSSPEKIKLGKEEMADIQNKVQYEMSKPGNTRTFEEIAKQVFKERYTEHNPDIDFDRLDNAVNGDNSVKISFEDESFVRSKVLPDTPSESYVEQVSDREASAKAQQNISARNREAAGNRALHNGTTVGNMLLSKTVASLSLASSIESASRKLGTSGEGELAVSLAEVTDARSAHDAQAMFGSSSGTSDFKKLTDDIGSRMKIISDLESELEKNGDGWKGELNRAVKNGDEESLNKLFGESTSYKSLKDTGMSALEAGKIVSAGLDTEDASKKELARQNALLDHSISKGEGPKDDIAQILIKILNLIQSAIK